MIRKTRLHDFAARFAEALEYAAKKHATQLRKGTRVPYLAHLLAVASLTLESNGGEEEAIAALLHDVVEDQGGKPTLEEIREKFGNVVARIVEGCSDSAVDPKPPWKGRKVASLAHLKRAPRSVRLVSAADKLHNARCIVADYRELGEELWRRFRGPKAEQLWYYRQLATVLRRAPERLSGELDRTVEEMERLAKTRSRGRRKKS